MLKLLIVDDFFVERENVIDIVRESGLELEIIGEAENGKDALGLMENCEPDFLLADIEMPMMDGLELAKIVRQKYPQVKIVFFSFYNKFEYARKAIDLDAYGYILKPVVPDEMVDSLKRMIDEKKNEQRKNDENNELKELLKQSKPLLVDKFKRDIFTGVYKQSDKIFEKTGYYQLDIRKGKYIVSTIEIDDYDDMIEINDVESRELLHILISKLIEDVSDRFQSCLWTRIDDVHWAILMGFDSTTSDGEVQEAMNMLSAGLAGPVAGTAISISVGLSTVFASITDTSKMLRQALYALQFKYNLGKGQIISIQDIQEGFEETDIKLDEMRNRLKNIVLTGNSEAVGPYIESVFSAFGVQTPKSVIKDICFSLIVCSQITLDELNVDFHMVFGKAQLVWEKLLKFETILDVKQWLNNILYSIAQFVKVRSAHQSRRLIDEAKDFIDKSYNKGITVKSIADLLHYNPNYLNNLFKQETGETILAYVTKVRIENAKKLLMESGIKIYEVAEAVGYSHESYFKNVFKQYIGISPKEYREKSNKR